MSVVKEVIKIVNNKLSFGNYLVEEKQKVSDFMFDGNSYKCKTHKDITRLEKNESLLIESVPGATFLDFEQKDGSGEFYIIGDGDTKITIEVDADCEFDILVNGKSLGVQKSNFAGKLLLACELSEEKTHVLIKKVVA